MKIFKIIVLISLSMFFSKNLYCQTQQELSVNGGNYYSSFYNKRYPIEVKRWPSGTVSIAVVVEPKNSQKTVLHFWNKDELLEFKRGLVLLKTKYEEWEKIADQYNVKNLTKDFNISFPGPTVIYKENTTQVWSSSIVKAKYFITPQGTSYCELYDVSDPNVIHVNGYKDRFSLIFTDADELEQFINLLDFEKLSSCLPTDYSNLFM